MQGQLRRLSNFADFRFDRGRRVGTRTFRGLAGQERACPIHCRQFRAMKSREKTQAPLTNVANGNQRSHKRKSQIHLPAPVDPGPFNPQGQICSNLQFLLIRTPVMQSIDLRATRSRLAPYDLCARYHPPGSRPIGYGSVTPT